MFKYSSATFCALALLTCSGEKTIQSSEASASWQTMKESLQAAELLASFRDGTDLCFIYKMQEDSSGFRLCNLWSGFPRSIDTLICIGPGQFHSPKKRTVYLVKQDSVISILDQKIIHPSSNWQGQSPWSEEIKAAYRRLDR